MEVAFAKMEGAGNDYVYVDAFDGHFPIERAGQLARCWSDRHFGIGSDGLIVLGRSTTADLRMSMWNADGSRGAMCGNGLRCVALFAHERGRVRQPRFRVETDVGVRQVELEFAAGVVVGVAAELGSVRVATTATEVQAAGRTIRCYRGDAGNPHAVVFIDHDPARYPLTEVGAALQQHPAFPGGVNLEVVQVTADGRLRQRTFERGSGETLACGTGAAAAAVAAIQLGLVSGPEVTVRLLGGDLRIRHGEGGLVIRGPARTVFRGVIALPPPE